MRTPFVLAIAIAILFTSPSSLACTAFMSSEKDMVLVGNNEDYYNPYTRIWFIPAANGQYGRVYFGYDDWRPQGGMNDQGLFFDAFATRPLEVIDKTKFKGNFFDKFMADCATVEEALDFFNRYNLEFMLKFQLLIVDKTGDSAIIEGDRIVRKKNQYQVVTNFYQSKVAYGDIPCEWYKGGCRRYQIAESMLKKNRSVSVEYFRDILKATHQNTLGVQTRRTNTIQ
jgi:penicillin V acylase-like amidase (Ntn superfamily)